MLRSLQRHWDDNNAAERALRTPVVGRKNYYGSGSRWIPIWNPAPKRATGRRRNPGDGSGPPSGLESSARPGGGMKRYCGRPFSGEEIGQLGALIADHPG